MRNTGINLSLIILLTFTCQTKAQKMENMSEHKGYKVGDVATGFKLKNVDNKMVSLSYYKEAKGFIIIFTCNHCPYAKAYENRIIGLNYKYAPKGYPIIAINPNSPKVEPQNSFEGNYRITFGCIFIIQPNNPVFVRFCIWTMVACENYYKPFRLFIIG